MKTKITTNFTVISALFSTVAYASTPIVQWSVSKHSSITDAEYSSTTFDNLLIAANVLIDYKDDACGDDVACALEIQRTGNMGIFANSGLDIIDSAEKLNAVLNLSGRVKVVREVNYCGGIPNRDFVGCGDINNDSFVIESSVASKVYLHEYIHNESTDGTHRNDCVDYVMNESIGLPDYNGNTINGSECTRMGGHVFTDIGGAIYDGNGGPLTTANDPYFITGDITVPSGRTLTINPGVKIQVDGYGFKGPPGGRVIGTGTPGTRIYSRCSNIHPCP